MKKYIGLAILLIALIGILAFIASYTNVRAPFHLGAPQGATITTAQLHDEGATYVISAQYPQFDIPAIDSQIKQAVDDAVAEVKGYPANPPESATPKNSLDVSFDNIYAGPDVISVELLISEYSGGAHPNTLYSAMSFDRTTGKKLTLDDALKMIGLTLQQLSDQASTTLAAKLGDGFQFRDGVAPTLDNFSAFLVSDKSVTFIFQPYQVAAYAAGAQQVTLPRR
jgi:hypothetical protein